MASLNYNRHHDRWRVSEYLGRVDGKIRSRQRNFRARDEALAYMVEKGLAVGGKGRRGGPGRKRRTREEVAQLLMANATPDESGCLVWQGALTSAGYGRMSWTSDEGHVIRGAHRLAYHLAVGPVPDDHLKSIDHLCRNRACVEPAHLELVSQRENVMRSPIAPGALNAAKTHCPQGHPYSPENTYVYTFKTQRTTTRICRTCQRAYQREYAARRRAARTEARQVSA